MTTEELGEVMESLGHHMSEAELQLMIDDVDKDHTGTMNVSTAAASAASADVWCLTIV